MVMPFIRLQVQKLITMRVAGTMPLFARIRSCMAFYHLFGFYPTDVPSGQIGAKIGVSGAISIILIQYEVYLNFDMQYSVSGYSGYALAL